MKRVLIAFIAISLISGCVLTVSAAGESSEVEITMFGTPAPDNHMDMINGFGSEYLNFAKSGIFENYDEGMKFGIAAFAVILAVFVATRIIRKSLGVEFMEDHDVRYLDIGRRETRLTDDVWKVDVLGKGRSKYD